LLIDGLLLDPNHPRKSCAAGTDWEAVKAPVQNDFAAAMLQVAVSPAGRSALREAGRAVLDAVQEVADKGWSEEARRSARGTLAALADEIGTEEAMMSSTSAVEHIMLSYNWDHQLVIKRINTSLQSRGYAVWIDIEKMQGSTVEAMAAAVEDAAVLVYGISRACECSAHFILPSDCNEIRGRTPESHLLQLPLAFAATRGSHLLQLPRVFGTTLTLRCLHFPQIKRAQIAVWRHSTRISVRRTWYLWWWRTTIARTGGWGCCWGLGCTTHFLARY
jgi:hypothetical protein